MERLGMRAGRQGAGGSGGRVEARLLVARWPRVVRLQAFPRPAPPLPQRPLSPWRPGQDCEEAPGALRPGQAGHGSHSAFPLPHSGIPGRGPPSGSQYLWL